MIRQPINEESCFKSASLLPKCIYLFKLFLLHLMTDWLMYLVIYFLFYFLILSLSVSSWRLELFLIWSQLSICVSIGSDQVRLVTMCLHRWDSAPEKSEVFGKNHSFFFDHDFFLIGGASCCCCCCRCRCRWLLFFSGFVQLHRILNPVKLSSGIFFMHLSFFFSLCERPSAEFVCPLERTLYTQGRVVETHGKNT